MTRRRAFLGALAAIALAPALPARAQSLLVNGSFESATVDPAGSYLTLSNGDTRIAGWTVAGTSIDYVGGFWQASSGQRSIDLDGAIGQSGILRQTFATLPGHTYEVTFDLAGNPDNAPTLKPLQVSAAGQSASFAFDVTGHTKANMGWRSEQWSFVASSASTTLELRSLTTPATTQGWGPAIDNVAAWEVVPGPLPWWLAPLLVGLCALAIERGGYARAAASGRTLRNIASSKRS